MSEKIKLPESENGTTIFNVPFPKNGDYSVLKNMTPIVIKRSYLINYIYSYGQDSPFFAALANGKLLGTRCPKCGYTYATPKGHCMYCGVETEWVELPPTGKVHTFTVCHFGSEEFLEETPFILALIEFEGVNTLFLTRLIGVDVSKPSLDWIGMEVKPRFKRNSQFKPTDVYFVPVDK